MTTPAVSDCPSCQGTGWVVRRREEAEGVIPCPSCRDAQLARRRLEKSGLPRRYEDRGFHEFSAIHPLQQRALERALEFVEGFDSARRGLLFVGPCGVGKTHLAAAILKALVQERALPCRFVDETELLRRLQYSYDRGSPETEREVLQPLMQAPLVVWDDLGTGRPTDWVRETIHTVINHRYTQDRLTVFTTNLPLEKPARAAVRADGISPGSVPARDWLGERLGERLFSRIMEMCAVVEIRGPDHRTEILKAGKDFGV